MENPWENVTSETSLDWQQMTNNISQLNCSVIENNDTNSLDGCPNVAGKIFLWFDIDLIGSFQKLRLHLGVKKTCSLLHKKCKLGAYVVKKFQKMQT